MPATATDGQPASLSRRQALAIVESQARINVLDGAVRSGKTISSLIWLMHRLQSGKAGPTLISGKTKDTIGRNVFEPMEELLGPEYDSSVQYTHGNNQAWIFGKRCHVIGAADAKAEGRIRGMTLGTAYLDEGTLLPEAFFKQVLARLSLKDAKLMVTTNPDNPRHWLRRDFILRADELDLSYMHFVLEDNPSLDPTYVASLKQEYTGLWYRRFIQGEWVVAAGAVYDQWDPDTMVVSKLPVDGKRVDWLRTWAACDYGTTNPFHALLFGLGPDGVVYVIDEWRWDSKRERRQKTDAEYSEQMRAWMVKRGFYPEWTYVDPSAASFVNQLYSDRHPGVRHADNEVLDGIRTVSSALTNGRLKIHRRCEHLIDEIGGYVWDEKQQERGEDAPKKLDDHGVDALRYGMHSGRHMWFNIELAA